MSGEATTAGAGATRGRMPKGPRKRYAGSGPDTRPDDPLAAAYAAVIEAHERLLQAVADSIATDSKMSARDRRRWVEWTATAAADLADLRLDNPFTAGGRA